MFNVFKDIRKKLRNILVAAAAGALGISVVAQGVFTVQCIKPDGSLRWEATAKNAATDVGLNKMLDSTFHDDASATWYIGLIRDDSYSELAAADTMASHAGWEEGDEYDEATREVYTEAAAASKSINNTGNEAEFTISGTETFKGAFLVDENTISGSTETLFCTALFTEGDRAAVDGDTLKVGYTVTLAAA